jgi:hypothetical protein
MQSLTGPEIAALIKAECIIVATHEFSQYMERDIESTRVCHRVYSVHLITRVEKDQISLDCGYDHVHAVNLMHPIEEPTRPHYVDEVVSRVCAKPGCKDASCVQLAHYNGGPCNAGGLSCCIVFGGDTCGWTVNMDLGDAIELAHSRAAHRGEDQGTVCSGQTVRIAGLHDTPELNGELGIALHFNNENGRWVVRLWNGEDKRLKPTNLEGLDGKGGRVLCFWGDTRWSRTHLLCEIAKGAWGICMGTVGDLVGPIEERWHNTNDRIFTAPKNAMTQDYLQNALTELRMPPMGTTK